MSDLRQVGPRIGRFTNYKRGRFASLFCFEKRRANDEYYHGPVGRHEEEVYVEICPTGAGSLYVLPRPSLSTFLRSFDSLVLFVGVLSLYSRREAAKLMRRMRAAG